MKKKNNYNNLLNKITIYAKVRVITSSCQVYRCYHVSVKVYVPAYDLPESSYRHSFLKMIEIGL